MSKLFLRLLTVWMFAAALVWARSAGPPVKHTGVPADGGQTCTACHTTYVEPGSDPAGNVGGIELFVPDSYTPGQKYLIQVFVYHPNGSRWGFQLTARTQNDETKQAGTFTVNPNVQVKCTDTQNAPCNGALEFASHVTASTRAGQTTGNTWSVEWTAPATDVGAVMFYAAGNAANNNNANTGDRIYKIKQRVRAQADCNLTLRPQLQGVSNAAADLRAGGNSSQRVVAPNSMISLFGSGFAAAGTSRITSAGDFDDVGFPRTLGCIAVEVVGGPRLPISFLSPGQINAQMPPLDTTGPVSLRVLVNPGTSAQAASDPVTVSLLRQAPAFFLFGGTKSIAALQVDNSYLADPAAIAGAKPVKPGDVAVLFGTGFGLTNPRLEAGALASGLNPLPSSGFSVTIGGVAVPPADVLYAGVTPGSISGLYQLNVKVPASVGDGNQPVVVTINGVSTPADAYIPVRR